MKTISRHAPESKWPGLCLPRHLYKHTYDYLPPSPCPKVWDDGSVHWLKASSWLRKVRVNGLSFSVVYVCVRVWMCVCVQYGSDLTRGTRSHTTVYVSSTFCKQLKDLLVYPVRVARDIKWMKGCKWASARMRALIPVSEVKLRWWGAGQVKSWKCRRGPLSHSEAWYVVGSTCRKAHLICHHGFILD